MSNIINIDNAKQHITIKCRDSVHVLPVSLMQDVIEGRKCFTEIERWQDIIKPILNDIINGE